MFCNAVVSHLHIMQNHGLALYVQAGTGLCETQGCIHIALSRTLAVSAFVFTESLLVVVFKPRIMAYYRL